MSPLAGLHIDGNRGEADPRAGKSLEMQSGLVVSHVPLPGVPGRAQPLLATARR